MFRPRVSDLLLSGTSLTGTSVTPCLRPRHSDFTAGLANRVSPRAGLPVPGPHPTDNSRLLPSEAGPFADTVADPKHLTHPAVRSTYLTVPARGLPL